MADRHAHVAVWFNNQQASQHRPLNTYMLNICRLLYWERESLIKVGVFLKTLSHTSKLKWALSGLYYTQYLIFLCLLQKPANILVMGEGPERGRVKIGKVD